MTTIKEMYDFVRGYPHTIINISFILFGMSLFSSYISYEHNVNIIYGAYLIPNRGTNLLVYVVNLTQWILFLCIKVAVYCEILGFVLRRIDSKFLRYERSDVYFLSVQLNSIAKNIELWGILIVGFIVQFLSSFIFESYSIIHILNTLLDRASNDWWGILQYIINFLSLTPLIHVDYDITSALITAIQILYFIIIIINDCLLIPIEKMRNKDNQ